MMNLFPEKYTYLEKEMNFDFYLKRTAHDSSLSICSYGLMAACIGKHGLSEEFFKKALFFDIDNRLLNTISGLHYANFGGVWQIAVIGFFGIEMANDRLTIKAKMPPFLDEIGTKIYYKGNQLRLNLTEDKLLVTVEEFRKSCQIEIDGELYLIKNEEKIITNFF